MQLDFDISNLGETVHFRNHSRAAGAFGRNARSAGLPGREDDEDEQAEASREEDVLSVDGSNF